MKVGEVMEKVLLTLQEFREYLGIGETKARELVRDPRNNFSLMIGNKWYVNKKELDEWLQIKCRKYKH